jgi:hypothetical protein
MFCLDTLAYHSRKLALLSHHAMPESTQFMLRTSFTKTNTKTNINTNTKKAREQEYQYLPQPNPKTQGDTTYRPVSNSHTINAKIALPY